MTDGYLHECMRTDSDEAEWKTTTTFSKICFWTISLSQSSKDVVREGPTLLPLLFWCLLIPFRNEIKTEEGFLRFIAPRLELCISHNTKFLFSFFLSLRFLISVLMYVSLPFSLFICFSGIATTKSFPIHHPLYHLYWIAGNSDIFVSFPHLSFFFRILFDSVAHSLFSFFIVISLSYHSLFCIVYCVVTVTITYVRIFVM